LKTAAIMPYGADRLPNGTLCGPETEERLDWTIMFIVAHPTTHFTIFLGAGLNPKEKGSDVPFKNDMKDYLEDCFNKMNNLPEEKRKPFIMPDIVLAEEDAWGTVAETLAVMKELQKRGISECYVVSSRYHIPRIMVIWNHIGSFKVIGHVAIKDSKAKPKMVLFEPAKFLATLFLPK
jgi:hypothetical protein